MPNLLVIDDDAGACEALCRALSSAGFRVKTALSAEEALYRLDREPFEGAVIDLALPGEGGAALVDRLRSDARFRELALVVHTATPVTPLLRLRLLEADAVVEKDGRPDQLLDVLACILQARSAEAVYQA